jgi:hypothetical protein
VDLKRFYKGHNGQSADSQALADFIVEEKHYQKSSFVVSPADPITLKIV